MFVAVPVPIAKYNQPSVHQQFNRQNVLLVYIHCAIRWVALGGLNQHKSDTKEKDSAFFYVKALQQSPNVDWRPIEVGKTEGRTDRGQPDQGLPLHILKSLTYLHDTCMPLMHTTNIERWQNKTRVAGILDKLHKTENREFFFCLH